MSKSFCFIVFFCTCLLGGCKKTVINLPYTGTPVFEKYDTVSPVILATELRMMYPIQTFAVDSLIFIVDMGGQEHFLQIYDDKGALLKEAVKRGRGPGEIIEFRRCALNKKDKTISFYNPGRIVEYDIAAILNDSPDYFSEIQIQDVREGGFSANARRLDEERIFWMGMSPEKRFAITDGEQQFIYSDYPVISEDAIWDFAISIYGETITFNENLDRFAKGTYIGAVLEIFRIDGTRIIPEEIKYIYKPLPLQTGKIKKDITWGDETTIGFEAMDGTDRYIYTVLNGRKGAELKDLDFENPPFADHISVFDWEGNPVRSVALGKNIMTVAAKNDSTLYAVAYNEGYSILKIEL